MEAYGASADVVREESGFLQRVFAWMVLGLAVTAAAAAVIGSSESLLTTITENPIYVIVVIVAQLGLVIALSAAINRISAPAAIAMFLLYAALNGVLFAFIFELYTTESIFTTFAICSAMFGALALWGATTKADLSKVGSIAFMALIGLILATVVNVFWANSTLYWVTTYAGVGIFAALTAFDMQKLKQIHERGGEAAGTKIAIFGALALYLDFINMFLFLLRIFGRAR
jgi:FtsH-binding integral membrane protein